jgi:hypothetical protein
MSAQPSRLVTLAVLAFILSQANLAYVLGHPSPNIVAVQLTFDSQAYWLALAQWGPEGIARYRATLLPWDMLHPLIYSVMGYLLAMRTDLFHALRPGWRVWLAWMLSVAGACDLAENVCALSLLSLPPGTHSILIPVSATFSLVKWGLVTGFALLTLMAWGRRLLPSR